MRLLVYDRPSANIIDHTMNVPAWKTCVSEIRSPHRTALRLPQLQRGSGNGVLRRFETWNVPGFESSRSPPRRRVGSVGEAVMVCFAVELKGGTNMIDEEIKP